MGDFNINILHCDSDKDTTNFIDTMYAISKTVIDNIFYNNFTKKIQQGTI